MFSLPSCHQRSGIIIPVSLESLNEERMSTENRHVSEWEHFQWMTDFSFRATRDCSQDRHVIEHIFHVCKCFRMSTSISNCIPWKSYRHIASRYCWLEKKERKRSVVRTFSFFSKTYLPRTSRERLLSLPSHPSADTCTRPALDHGPNSLWIEEPLSSRVTDFFSTRNRLVFVDLNLDSTHFPRSANGSAPMSGTSFSFSLRASLENQSSLISLAD